MKNIKKFILLIILFSSLIQAVTGCRQQTDNTQKEKTESTPNTDDILRGKSVDIIWWEYPNFNIRNKPEGEYELDMIAAFREKNPGVNVKLEMITFSSGPEKVNLAIATNSKPDMIFDYPGRIIGYGRQGVLVPLNDMFTDEIKRDIPENILNLCSLKDNVYMYPFTNTPFFIGVNKTLFEKNGLLNLLPLERPERNWTPGEFEKALEAIKSKVKGVYPSVFYCKDIDGDASTRFLIMNLFGTDLINSQNNHFVINSENGVKGLQWIIDKSREGLFAPNPETYTATDAIDMFSKGKAASVIIYSPILQKIYGMNKSSSFEEVFLPYPAQPGENPRMQVSVFGQCVFDNKDPLRAAAAKKLIDFLNNDSEWGKKNVVSNGGSPVKISWSGMYSDSEQQYAESMVKYAANSAVTVPYFSEVRLHWFPALQDALLGRKTAREALDRFVEESDRIINR